jgi:hypothetical protein
MNRADKFASIIKGRNIKSAPSSKPSQPKVGVANFSDLHGATNPTGIMSPAFLFLKRTLDSGAPPEEVTQALYAWLENKTQRGVDRQVVDKLLKLKPDLALDRLVQMIGGQMRTGALPPLVISTLRKTLSHIAGNYVAGKEQRMARQNVHLGGIRKRYGVESAQQLAASLLEG